MGVGSFKPELSSGDVWMLLRTGPLEKGSLELMSTKLWCNLYQVWKLAMLCSTCQVMGCVQPVKLFPFLFFFFYVYDAGEKTIMDINSYNHIIGAL